VDYPFWVTRHKKTLAIRVSGYEPARKLAGLSAGVMISTSANKSGEPPVTSAKEAVKMFSGEVDVIIDGGQSPGEIPSTVLDLSSEELWIHRIGPISGEDIIKALKS
jgi:L-threonylcarbamoyladenylate synthase